MITHDALTDYLAGREACADCGGTRFRTRVLIQGLLGVSVCQNRKCKAEGRKFGMHMFVAPLVKGLGGRWMLNVQEEKELRACRAIRTVIRRLGK